MASAFLRSAGSTLRRSLPRAAATAEQRFAARPPSSMGKTRLFSSESAGNAEQNKVTEELIHHNGGSGRNFQEEQLRLLRQIKDGIEKGNRNRVNVGDLMALSAWLVFLQKIWL